MAYAGRLVPRDQALEIAHDVAVEMLSQFNAPVSNALLYMRVTSRLRDAWRAQTRRSALDGAYAELRASVMPSWAQPGAELEARELRERINDVLAGMPDAMRNAYLLVREEELTYKEAAIRLGVTVSTVHTQLSRANVLLRECVKRYHADAPIARSSEEQR
jgi:RNA polymerase sigma-70 factor (ECF subfamily)